MNAYNRFAQMMQPQEVGGISPVFQNLAQQQALQNAAMQQGMGLTNQAGMTVDGKQAGAGMNPMMMAMMLRRQPNQQQMNANDVQMGGMRTYNPFTQFDISNTYGTNPYSQQSRMLASQEF